jgi:hypothetical protein
MQGADVRVIQARDGVRLAIEALTLLGITRRVRGQDFDRDCAIQACVSRR